MDERERIANVATVVDTTIPAFFLFFFAVCELRKIQVAGNGSIFQSDVFPRIEHSDDFRSRDTALGG